MSEFIQHLINGISVGSVYALIAIGYSMVYGILQLINFAHGEVVMLGAVFGFFLAPKLRMLGDSPSLQFFFCGAFFSNGCLRGGGIFNRTLSLSTDS